MDVMVYSAAWCRDCREAKRFLEKHQIAYTEIDIENTPGAAEEVMRQVGKRAIPQFVVDGKWVQPYRPGLGFLYEEMSELFGVGGPATCLPSIPASSRDRFYFAIRRSGIVQDAARVHFVLRAHLQLQPSQA